MFTHLVPPARETDIFLLRSVLWKGQFSIWDGACVSCVQSRAAQGSHRQCCGSDTLWTYDFFPYLFWRNIHSCCLVSEENCRTIALSDPWVSPATPYVGRSDIQTEGSNKLMEELEMVHVHPVLLHVPLVWVIINTMTQILNGIVIFTAKVNKHKLGFARALCWDDFRL